MISECVVYHIKTSRSSICPEETWQCITLSQFVAQRFRDLNVSLIFLSGNHSLTKQLNISNVNIITLSAHSIVLPAIVCKRNASIVLSNIHNAYIGNIDIIGCHGHKMNKIERLVVENSSFVNHFGSALTVSSSNVQILRTLFNSNLGGSLQQCSLPRDSFYTMAGAALVSKQSSIVISECVFQGNTAEVGGAVFAELHSKILILNTVFERNNAACTTKCVGGALYSKNSFISIYNSTFYNNKLINLEEDVYINLYGGVFGLFVSIFSTENCTFLQNGPNIPPKRAYAYGGVIFAYNTTATFLNCEFTNNHNVRIGGALSASRAFITIMGSNFTSNSAEYFGGAVNLDEGEITLNESTFKHNTNAIRCKEAKATIIRCNFEDNVIDGFGGAVYLEGNSITVSNSSFCRNHAELKGGALHLSFSDVKVLSSWFVNNTAGGKDELFFNGGAITIRSMQQC